MNWKPHFFSSVLSLGTKQRARVNIKNAWKQIECYQDALACKKGLTEYESGCKSDLSVSLWRSLAVGRLDY